MNDSADENKLFKNLLSVMEKYEGLTPEQEKIHADLSDSYMKSDEYKSMRDIFDRAIAMEEMLKKFIRDNGEQ